MAIEMVSFTMKKMMDLSIAMYVKVYQRVPLLVGGWATPLKNDGVRQLGWWHSQDMEQIKFMFQTTNQTKI